ncbi:hypothetical protein RRG02_27640, partial [Escherichia coli]
MQNLGQDSATKVNSGGQYTLGRSKDEFQPLARAEDLQVAGGTAIVYAGTLNRPGFPGEYFICELRLPAHHFRWKHNTLFLLLPEEYGPAFPA